MMNIEPERLKELQPPQNNMGNNNMGGGIDIRDVGPFREIPYFSGNNGYWKNTIFFIFVHLILVA